LYSKKGWKCPLETKTRLWHLGVGKIVNNPKIELKYTNSNNEDVVERKLYHEEKSYEKLWNLKWILYIFFEKNIMID